MWCCAVLCVARAGGGTHSVRDGSLQVLLQEGDLRAIRLHVLLARQGDPVHITVRVGVPKVTITATLLEGLRYKTAGQIQTDKQAISQSVKKYPWNCKFDKSSTHT